MNRYAKRLNRLSCLAMHDSRHSSSVPAAEWQVLGEGIVGVIGLLQLDVVLARGEEDEAPGRAKEQAWEAGKSKCSISICALLTRSRVELGGLDRSRRVESRVESAFLRVGA